MTDFETAEEMATKHFPKDADWNAPFVWGVNAILEAIQSERERCAAICEELASAHATSIDTACNGCAAAIRGTA